MQDESTAFAHQRVQSVKVAMIPTVVSGLLAPALCRFRNRLPGARVSLLDLAANEVAEAVAAGEVDFGICSIPILEPATEFELLFNDPMVLAVSPAHAFCTQANMAWPDLAGRSSHPAGKRNRQPVAHRRGACPDETAGALDL